MEQFDEDTASIDEIVDEQQIDAIAGALHKLVDLATS